MAESIYHSAHHYHGHGIPQALANGMSSQHRRTTNGHGRAPCLAADGQVPWQLLQKSRAPPPNAWFLLARERENVVTGLRRRCRLCTFHSRWATYREMLATEPRQPRAQKLLSTKIAHPADCRGRWTLWALIHGSACARCVRAKTTKRPDLPDSRGVATSCKLTTNCRRSVRLCRTWIEDHIKPTTCQNLPPRRMRARYTE